MFGQGSNPAVVQTWHSDAEISDLLGKQLSRITTLLWQHELQISQWAVEGSMAAAHTGGRTPLAGMIHGWHDEARHQGEMYLLHKLCRAQFVWPT
jgi:hypothetical protein